MREWEKGVARVVIKANRIVIIKLMRIKIKIELLNRIFKNVGAVRESENGGVRAGMETKHKAIAKLKAYNNYKKVIINRIIISDAVRECRHEGATAVPSLRRSVL